MTIPFETFASMDLRVATIATVEEIEGADKLYKITLDVGSEETGGLGMRTVAAGIKPFYTPDQLLGRQILYLANLESKILRGVESQGMILAAGDDQATLLHPAKLVPNGTRLR